MGEYSGIFSNHRFFSTLPWGSNVVEGTCCKMPWLPNISNKFFISVKNYEFANNVENVHFQPPVDTFSVQIIKVGSRHPLMKRFCSQVWDSSGIFNKSKIFGVEQVCGNEDRVVELGPQ